MLQVSNIVDDLLLHSYGVREDATEACQAVSAACSPRSAPVIRVGSVCSGLGTAEMVYDALNEAFKRFEWTSVQA